MRKLYENFHIFHFQKRIVSAETIRGNTVPKGQLISKCLLGVIVSTKKTTNFFKDFCPSL